MRFYCDIVLPNVSVSSKEMSMTNYFCFGDFDRKIFSDSGVDMNQFSLVGSLIGGI